MQINVPEIQIHNKFEFKLIDAKTNEVIQEGCAYNVANSQRYTMASAIGKWPGHSIDGRESAGAPTYILLGDGVPEEGEVLEPSVDDRGLWHQVYRFSVGWTKTNSFNPPRYQTTVTLGATTSYVANLTEIGLAYYSSSKYGGGTYLYTHAVLKDWDGNQIIVEKTANNILVVTATMYFTIGETGQNYTFYKFPKFAAAAYGNYNTTSGDNRFSGLPTAHPGTWGFSPQIAYKETADGRLLSSMSNDVSDFTFSRVYDAGQTTWEFPARLESVNQRIGQMSSNVGFMHSIIYENFGVIPLPNTGICPAYMMEGINVGIADGTKTNFFTAVNETQSVTVYVDGVVAEASFQNFDITKSPLWNMCIGVGEFANGNLANSDLIKLHKIDEYKDNGGGSITQSPIALCLHAWDGGTPAPCNDYYMPIYYSAAGITIDHFRAGAISWSYYSGAGYEFNGYLDYSEDGVNWTRACEITTMCTTVYFDAITAPYWRIYTASSRGHSRRVGWSDCNRFSDNVLVSNGYCAGGYDHKAWGIGYSPSYDFGKVGINFDVPPPEGSVITMDAVLNLPYKSKDTLLVASCAAEIYDPGN